VVRTTDWCYFCAGWKSCAKLLYMKSKKVIHGPTCGSNYINHY
jgi:hypothetical protein